MNNIEISRFLKHHPLTKKIFRGVFPCDKLPSNKLSPLTSHGLVINTASSKQKGEHWVSVFIAPGGKCEYFDSFGFPPKNFEIDLFLKRHSSHFTWNSRPIQDPLSLTCGLYVIYYLLCKSRGYSLHRTLSHFNIYSPTQNDRKIVKKFNHVTF